MFITAVWGVVRVPVAVIMVLQFSETQVSSRVLHTSCQLNSLCIDTAYTGYPLILGSLTKSTAL